jgi:CelD/BcsL family acetyltransferase involved in cellulose biosynthesis
VVVSGHRGGLEILDEFAAEWNALSDDAIEDQPFFRVDWIRAYFRAFEPQARILLITAYADGRLVLILPLIDEIATFSKVPVRRLRVPVNYCSSRFDAVRRTGPEGEIAISSTWEYLQQLGGWDLVLFRDALEGSTVGCLADCAKAEGLRTLCVTGEASPFIPVPANPQQLQRMPLNSKLRSQLKQIRERLKQHGTLSLLCTQTADHAALERFYQLEVSGWKGHSPDGLTVLNEGVQSFYNDVASFAARDGYFSLYTLQLNNTVIATHYSLTHRDRCYSPKVAYNEDYKPFAPGHLIIAEILRDCCGRGITGFDITGQAQPWKMKWTTQTRAVHHHYIFKGPVGAVAHAMGTSLKPSVWGHHDGSRAAGKTN